MFIPNGVVRLKYQSFCNHEKGFQRGDPKKARFLICIWAKIIKKIFYGSTYSAHNLCSGEALEFTPSSPADFCNSCLASGFSRRLHHLANVDHMERGILKIQRPFSCMRFKMVNVSLWIIQFIHLCYSITDTVNQTIVTSWHTSGRDIINSLPRLSDVCITVLSTCGKVLCYYFVEVSTWHHTRKLPYWCGGCQSSEIQEEAKLFLLIFSQNDRHCTSIIPGDIWITLV